MDAHPPDFTIDQTKITFQLSVEHKTGLSLRTGSKVVECILGFAGRVRATFQCGKGLADPKSPFGLSMLGAMKGSVIDVQLEGSPADVAEVKERLLQLRMDGRQQAIFSLVQNTDVSQEVISR